MRALAVFLALHGLAHLAGTSNAFDTAAGGGTLSWLGGAWEVDDPALMRALGVVWAALAVAYAGVAALVWRGDARWARALGLVTAASLALVAVALWSSIVGLAVDVALLALALRASNANPKGADHVHAA